MSEIYDFSLNNDPKGLIKFLRNLSKKAINKGVRLYRDDEGRSCLHVACEKNFSDIVLLLLEHGADVDSKCKLYGFTALRYSIHHASIECLETLLQNSSDIEKVFSEKDDYEGTGILHWLGISL